MPILPGRDTLLGAFARVRSWYRAVAHRDEMERGMREEFAHHLAARTDDLVRHGLTPDEAAERARREFGHAGSHRTEAREALGLASFAQVRFSWLDIKLGLRMLPKYPMLNIAAILALAVGIPVGLAPSHLSRALEAPLPGDPTGRVVAIRQWDPLASAVAPTREDEFTHWAGALTSFSALGAFRTSSYSVGASDGPAIPVTGAQLSASVLSMIDARPLMGRVLAPGDFDAGAPSVVVIGDALWSARFGRDPAILGRSIRIGSDLHTVVGVMPGGFSFPSNESLWLPMRTTSPERGVPGRTVQIIGRLADGVTLGTAQAELTRAGSPQPAAVIDADEAEERARRRAEVVPFGLLFLGLPAGGLAAVPEFRFVQALMIALLLVASGNVAMLMFARTATRLRELAIRAALGASRTRIVSQIFIETLLLALVAAGVGVLAVDWALDHANLAALAGESSLPYWLSLGLTPRTVLTALALAACSATVAGALPAIVITGRAISQGMGGQSRVRFGRLTGALVVADIAVSVAAVAMAFTVARHATDLRMTDRAAGIPSAEYLAVELRLPEDGATFRAARGGVPGDGDAIGSASRDEGDRTASLPSRLAADQRELLAMLSREPGIERVAVGDALPRAEHRSRPFEVDGAEPTDARRRRWTRVARVDVGFFTALGTSMLRGRGFAPSDTDERVRVAIVNTAFVERNLAGGEALGRRVRFPTAQGADEDAWYEIIGVVPHLGVNVLNPERGEAVYLPAPPGAINPMQLGIHTTVPPVALTSRIRDMVAAVDPDLVVTRVSPLSEIRQGDWYLVMGLAAGLAVLAVVLVCLATSGLYAMLALAVSERTREIGVRTALGATRARLLLTILRRPLLQIALGALIGMPLAAQFLFELSSEESGGGSATTALLGAMGLSSGIVLLVGLLSCLVPMRRVLAIDASEAMRAEG